MDLWRSVVTTRRFEHSVCQQIFYSNITITIKDVQYSIIALQTLLSIISSFRFLSSVDGSTSKDHLPIISKYTKKKQNLFLEIIEICLDSRIEFKMSTNRKRSNHISSGVRSQNKISPRQLALPPPPLTFNKHFSALRPHPPFRLIFVYCTMSSSKQPFITF